MSAPALTHPKTLALTLLLAAISFAWAPSLHAAEDEAAREIDVFEGMANGDIETKIIVKSTEEARVIVTNNTDQPLTVTFPPAFAGLPILAQGGQGAGGGAPAFNVPPEKVVGKDIQVVCLEYGKKDPRSVMKYEIRPITAITSDGRVVEVLKALAAGRVSQPVAQAATWHFTDGLSWDYLVAKTRKRSGGIHEMFFTKDQIRTAMRLAKYAEENAEDLGATSPGNRQASATE